MNIILASASPFRKKALEVLGVSYRVVPSNINEKAIRDENPSKLAQKLSEAKARAVAPSNGNALIVAADLFVTMNGKIFEKPADMTEAVEMLRAFSGKKLEIVTGLAVYNSGTQKMLSATESCTVEFRKLSEHEITDYVSRYPVLLFAGAFNDEGMLRFSERVEGNYNVHAALPMNRLVEFLRENGLEV
jgi:septum formation protein